MIVMCAAELRDREIQKAEWAQKPPHDSLSEMMRMQEIIRFNHQMTRQYGHLREVTADAEKEIECP